MMYFIKWKNGELWFKMEGQEWKSYKQLPGHLVKPDPVMPGIKISKGFATMQYLIKNNLAVYLQDTPNYEDD